MSSGDNMKTLEEIMEKQEKEIEEKITKSNESLIKSEEIEIDEF